MKVMVIVKATQRSEAGLMPDEKLLTEMGKFNEQLAKAGILISGEGLHPSSKGIRVLFSGANRTTTDGPFPATNELIAGFWLWRVKSMAEAIEWVKRCPNPMPTDSEIEIRPLLETEDFGEAATPETREQEAMIRAQNMGLNILRFENGRSLLIAGLKYNYVFVSPVNIPAQWARFLPQLERIPGRVGKVTFGISSDFKPGGGFGYLSGVEVSSSEGLPEDLTSLQIPPQRYAVFSHSEHVSSIPEAMEKIKQWTVDSGIKSAESPCIERYTEQFNPQTGIGGIEILIPITK